MLLDSTQSRRRVSRIVWLNTITFTGVVVMYKANAIEAYGPFCGRGGFGSVSGTGFGRSPKQAIARALRNMAQDHNTQTQASGDYTVGGGVPILAEIVLSDGRGREVAVLPCDGVPGA